MYLTFEKALEEVKKNNNSSNFEEKLFWLKDFNILWKIMKWKKWNQIYFINATFWKKTLNFLNKIHYEKVYFEWSSISDYSEWKNFVINKFNLFDLTKYWFSKEWLDLENLIELDDNAINLPNYSPFWFQNNYLINTEFKELIVDDILNNFRQSQLNFFSYSDYWKSYHTLSSMINFPAQEYFNLIFDFVINRKLRAYCKGFIQGHESDLQNNWLIKLEWNDKSYIEEYYTEYLKKNSINNPPPIYICFSEKRPETIDRSAYFEFNSSNPEYIIYFFIQDSINKWQWLVYKFNLNKLQNTINNRRLNAFKNNYGKIDLELLNSMWTTEFIKLTVFEFKLLYCYKSKKFEFDKHNNLFKNYWFRQTMTDVWKFNESILSLNIFDTIDSNFSVCIRDWKLFWFSNKKLNRLKGFLFMHCLNLEHQLMIFDILTRKNIQYNNLTADFVIDERITGNLPKKITSIKQIPNWVRIKLNYKNGHYNYDFSLVFEPLWLGSYKIIIYWACPWMEDYTFTLPKVHFNNFTEFLAFLEIF